MDARRMMEIDGRIDHRNVEQADNPITEDEREYAIDVARAMAKRAGLDLDALIEGQRKSEADYLSMLFCSRCSHEWYPRTAVKPRVCPKCKSPYWDRPRKG